MNYVYTNKMMQAFVTVLKVGGKESIVYIVVKDTAEWINKNEHPNNFYLPNRHWIQQLLHGRLPGPSTKLD